MKMTVYFIFCKPYDFINEQTGEQVKGISCKCFDPESKQIISVKTANVINAEFADPIEVAIKISGRYVTYEYVA